MNIRLVVSASAATFGLLSIAEGAATMAREAAEGMASLGLTGNVTPGLSVMRDGSTEAMVDIVLFDATYATAAALFGLLRNQYGLTCCWIEYGDYAGCILKAPDAVLFGLLRSAPWSADAPAPTFPRDARMRAAPHGDPFRDTL